MKATIEYEINMFAILDLHHDEEINLSPAYLIGTGYIVSSNVHQFYTPDPSLVADHHILSEYHQYPSQYYHVGSHVLLCAPRCIQCASGLDLLRRRGGRLDRHCHSHR